MKFLLLVFTLIFFQFGTSELKAGDYEDYSWWNKTHNWDGITPWVNYLKTSSAYFGPNALPVPSLNQAKISSSFRFEFRPEYHWSKGDKTTNVYTSLKLPLASRVDFEIFIVPVEYFELDSATRFERAVRHINASGFEGGDFWFGTNFQILKQKASLPDLVASFYFKTASGTGLDYARYTDAPAYLFQLAAGKDVINNAIKDRLLRLYGQMGFFAYQTWDPLHNQNDCIIYGLGIQFTGQKLISNVELAGYSGYLGNGDNPFLIKFKISTKRQKLNFAVNLQSGIHDFEYQTIGLSMIYNIGRTFKL